jgi:hypothetical protein
VFFSECEDTIQNPINVNCDVPQSEAFRHLAVQPVATRWLRIYGSVSSGGVNMSNHTGGKWKLAVVASSRYPRRSVTADPSTQDFVSTRVIRVSIAVMRCVDFDALSQRYFRWAGQEMNLELLVGNLFQSDHVEDRQEGGETASRLHQLNC